MVCVLNSLHETYTGINQASWYTNIIEMWKKKFTIWKVDHTDEYNFLIDKPTLCTELQENSLGTDQSSYDQMLSGKTSCQSVKWNEQMQLFSVRLRSVHWWLPSSNYWCCLYVYESLGLGNLQINNKNNFYHNSEKY